MNSRSSTAESSAWDSTEDAPRDFGNEWNAPPDLLGFQSALTAPSDLPARLQAVVGTIHAQFFRVSLNVASVKASCRIRDHNVSSEFRHRFGVSIRQYIESHRLAAVEHLRGKGVPITLAARKVGFQSVQTYYRARARNERKTGGPLSGIVDTAVQRKGEANL